MYVPLLFVLALSAYAIDVQRFHSSFTKEAKAYLLQTFRSSSVEQSLEVPST
jgi:hypothetical protein